MRIVFATGIYPPDIGGPATYVRRLAGELHRRGEDVEVVTYGEAAKTDSPYFVRRVSRQVSLPLRYLSFFVAVRRASRAADLVYLQDPLSSGLPGLLAARSLGRPAIVKIVGDLAWEIASGQGLIADSIEDFQTRRYGLVIEAARRSQRFVARNAERVLVPCHYLKTLVSGWGVTPARIDVVYNSLPKTAGPAPPREEARRQLSLRSETVLISAGRMVPWKGFDTLIRLMPDLLAQHPSLRLLIVGAGPCENELKCLARELNLGDAVTFTGQLDTESMALHLRASDLMVLLSSYEGFSHLLLEAMSAGLPVLASDVGGNHELIENGETGILAPVSDPDRIKESLMKLCGDAGLRARLARAGQARISKLSWEQMFEETSAVFQRAFDVHSRSRAASNKLA
jgi:glycosyltransferase involved in cell wall biosynthesis